MLRFDLRNGNLRKKFDALKYTLKKMESLLYELQLAGEASECRPAPCRCALTRLVYPAQHQYRAREVMRSHHRRWVWMLSRPANAEHRSAAGSPETAYDVSGCSSGMDRAIQPAAHHSVKSTSPARDTRNNAANTVFVWSPLICTRTWCDTIRICIG